MGQIFVGLSLSFPSPFDTLTLMDAVFTLEEIGLRDASRVGKKAAALGELQKIGAPVSAAFIVPTASYAEYFSQPQVKLILEAGSSLGLEELKVRLFSVPFPRILKESLQSSYRVLSGPRDIFVSVQGGNDDAKVLGEEELVCAVKRVWVDHAARLIRSGRDITREPLPVFVQQVEKYDTEGRLLTSDPYTDRVGLMVVEVDHRNGKEKLFFEKGSGRLVKRLTVGVVAEPIAPERITPIVSWAARMEKVLGAPQKLAWGLCQGTLSFLQTAPLYLRPKVSVATGVWSRAVAGGDAVPSNSVGLLATTLEQAVSLAQEFPGKPVLFELDAIEENVLVTFREARHKGGQRNLHLILPPAQTVDSLREAKRNIAGEGLSRSAGLKFYLRLALPANVVLLDRLLKVGVDGVLFDARRLVQGFLGAKGPAGPSVLCAEPNSVYAEQNDLILWAVDVARQACRAVGAEFLYDGGRIDEGSVANLLRRGVSRVVVDASEVQRLLSVLPRVERELLKA